MSTPERPQDPGEHGYGGTKQEFPTADDSRDKEHRLEDDDDRSTKQGDGDDVRQGGWPADPEPHDRGQDTEQHTPNDDQLIKKLTHNPDTDENEPIPSG